MMKISGDPLLSGGFLIIRCVRNILAIGAALLLLAAPLAVIFGDNILSAVHAHFSIADSYYPTGSVVALLVSAAFVLALWWLFFRYLANIVETLAQGDPFIAENASRLQRMAWLLIAIQLAYIPTAALGLLVETAWKGPTSEVQVFWDFTGLLMVITLFVIARVFRQGTEMRSDLAGTV